MIIVTGSRIPRTNLTAVSPVTVVKGQEVQLEGVTNVEEMLNRLPQIAPSQGLFLANGSNGTAQLDLRDLGPPRTLVLINGRRLGPGGPDQPVADVNIIPPTLIQRVEVLTGGASSVYGSDAVAGVINFILDTRFEGIRVDGQASVFQHENNTLQGIRDALDARGFPYPRGNAVDGGRQDINVAVGHGFFGGRAHVSIYGGYRKASPLTQDARDYSACTLNFDRNQPDAYFCGGSPVSAPGNFVDNFGDVFQIGPDRTFVTGPIDFFNFAPWNYYQRSDQRYTAGAFADFDLSPALQPYLELMWMKDDSVAQIAPSANFGNTTEINCDSALLSPQQLSLICVNGNFVGQFPVLDDEGNLIRIEGSPTPFIDPVTGATYLKGVLQPLRRNVEGGGRRFEFVHKSIRALGGFKGELARGVSYDASYLYGRAAQHREQLADFSTVRLARSLDVVSDPATGQPVCRSVLTGEDPDCVPWDIFALDTVTPEALAYLQLPSTADGKVTEQVANANATVNLGTWGIRSPWADEDPSINFGAEYRKDKLDWVPDELAQRGELAGNGTAELPIHGSTDVKELFAETRIPLLTDKVIKRLAFEGGYRQSWYGNGQASFATNAYKLALDLTPVEGLRFRGSLQRAVRAPNIVELFNPPVSDFFEFDRCAGVTPEASAEECALTGVTAAQYGNIFKIPDDAFLAYNSQVGGNAELQPETAKTRTLGVVLQPAFLQGFNATVDWWDIKLTGAIQQIGAQTIMDTCLATGDPVFCTKIHRDANGSLWRSPQGFIDDRQANIGSLHLRGIDIGANYTRHFGGVGTINLDFMGTYVQKWRIDNGGLAVPFDCAGLYGADCVVPTPKWKHKARLSWTPVKPATLSLQWRHTSSMELATKLIQPVVSPLDEVLPAASFFDLSALFNINRDYSFRVGVNNIFDKEPPIVVGGEGACALGCNGNTYPQWYDPLGRYFFAGVRMNLKPF